MRLRAAVLVNLRPTTGIQVPIVYLFVLFSSVDDDYELISGEKL